MAAKEKTSDAVRITRIIAPTVLIIVLAVLFKSQIGGSLDRGCFEISIEDAGIDFSDKSLCTASDITEFADTLTKYGATKVEKEADFAFNEYEKLLEKMKQEQDLLKKNLERTLAVIGENDNRIFDYAISLKNKANESTNRIENEVLLRQHSEFVETFNVAPVRVSSVVEIALPTTELTIKDVSANIKTRYSKSAQLQINQVQENIIVRQK